MRLCSAGFATTCAHSQACTVQVELLIGDQSGAVAIWDMRRPTSPPNEKPPRNPRPLVRAPRNPSCPRGSGSPSPSPSKPSPVSCEARRFLCSLTLHSCGDWRHDTVQITRDSLALRALAAAASRAVRWARLCAVRYGGHGDHSRRRRQLARTHRALLLVHLFPIVHLLLTVDRAFRASALYGTRARRLELQPFLRPLLQSTSRRRPFLACQSSQALLALAHRRTQSLRLRRSSWLIRASSRRSKCSSVRTPRMQWFSVTRALSSWLLSRRLSVAHMTRARRLMATSSADCSAHIWRTSDLPSNLLERGAEEAAGARAARSEAGRRQKPAAGDEEGGRRERDAVGGRELVLRPIAVLRDPTSRWVWDCAFAADSQYLFTGVLSAPTAFCLTYSTGP